LISLSGFKGEGRRVTSINRKLLTSILSSLKEERRRKK
jgi:hypothetical protein